MGKWAGVVAIFVLAACGPREEVGGADGSSSLTCKDAVSGESRAIRTPEKGALRISEWRADPREVEDSLGEWVEVFAAASLDLNGVLLESGSTHQELTGENCLSLEAGQFGLLARSGDSLKNGGLPAVLSSVTVGLPNSNGSLRLLSGSTELDAVQWTTSTPGASTQVELAGDAGTSCQSTQTYGAGDKGTPAAPNTPCPIPAKPAPAQNSCIDERGDSRPLRVPLPGQLLITEFMPDPAAVDDRLGEFIEILATADVDLNGLSLTNGTSSQTLTSTACLRVVPGDYRVLARSADPSQNGGLPSVLTTLGIALSNTGTHTVTLALSDGGIVDQASYTDSKPGASWQLNPLRLTAIGNDSPASFCLSQRGIYGGSVGGDYGTPGMPNEACP